MFAVLRETSSELYYRSTPHHDAVREKETSCTDRWSAICFTRPLCQGLASCHALAWLFLAWLPTWLITKPHLACCQVTRLNLIVCWCWLLNFSISFYSFTPAPWILSVTSYDAFVQWSLGRHGQGLQIDSWNYNNFHTFPTTFSVQIQSCVLLCQIG